MCLPVLKDGMDQKQDRHYFLLSLKSINERYQSIHGLQVELLLFFIISLRLLNILVAYSFVAVIGEAKYSAKFTRECRSF